MTEKPYPFTPEQEAWLRDLETTEEPQTKGYLRVFDGDSTGSPVGYCCLGRAAVVLGVSEDPLFGHGYSRFTGETKSLDSSDYARLGLRNGAGALVEQVIVGDDDNATVCTHLTCLNDLGWSFKEIAAYIRANHWNVFLPPEEETA